MYQTVLPQCGVHKCIFSTDVIDVTMLHSSLYVLQLELFGA